MQANRMETVLAWIAAVNHQQLDELLELSDQQIEIVGPRGSGFGHALLGDWIAQAGLSLEVKALWQRRNEVLVEAIGKWSEAESRARVVMLFGVANGRIRRFQRLAQPEGVLAESDWQKADLPG